MAQVTHTQALTVKCGRDDMAGNMLQHSHQMPHSCYEDQQMLQAVASDAWVVLWTQNIAHLQSSWVNFHSNWLIFPVAVQENKMYPFFCTQWKWWKLPEFRHRVTTIFRRRWVIKVTRIIQVQWTLTMNLFQTQCWQAILHISFHKIPHLTFQCEQKLSSLTSLLSVLLYTVIKV